MCGKAVSTRECSRPVLKHKIQFLKFQCFLMLKTCNHNMVNRCCRTVLYSVFHRSSHFLTRTVRVRVLSLCTFTKLRYRTVSYPTVPHRHKHRRRRRRKSVRVPYRHIHSSSPTPFRCRHISVRVPHEGTGTKSKSARAIRVSVLMHSGYSPSSNTGVRVPHKASIPYTCCILRVQYRTVYIYSYADYIQYPTYSTRTNQHKDCDCFTARLPHIVNQPFPQRVYKDYRTASAPPQTPRPAS